MTRVDSETSFQGGGRILVVDDEELLREMVKAMLNRLGFAEQPQAFLHKPFQMKTLKKALEKVLKSGRTQGE